MGRNELKLIKRRLKGVQWLRRVNSEWKARAVKRRYQATVRRYAEIPARSGAVRLIKKKSGDNLDQSGSSDGRLNIFFLGTDEEQDTSGMLQALERIGRVTRFTRADGSHGQNDPASYWTRRQNNTNRLLELVDGLAKRGRAPDVLIAQTWGSLVVPAALSEIRSRHGTYIINISMDDRHQYWGRKVRGEWNGVYPLIPHIDLALTAAPECVEWYLKEGCPAVFFPEASDPEIFHPMPGLPKVHDVVFVGARYGIRKKIVHALRHAGIQVTTYGEGWNGGRIATADAPKLFAQSKIILGVGTIGHCSDFFALKMRDFDAPMSGSCYVTHNNADLHTLYEENKEIVMYRSVGECVEKVKQYLADDVSREEIAAAGCQRARRDHTWDKRFTDLMSLLRTTDV